MGVPQRSMSGLSAPGCAGFGSERVGMDGAAGSTGPGDDVAQAPDAAHRQDGHWLGEVVALGELVDACAVDGEQPGQFLTADQLLHPTSIDTCIEPVVIPLL